MNHDFHVGGSLQVNTPTYVKRKADTQLYEALLRGEFCYVFNCRQMGKSSLRVRIKNRLEQQGYACVSLDMSNIGSKTISPSQWYKSIASELWRGFGLMGKVKFKLWWQEQQGLSLIKQLDRFISDVILPTVDAEKLFIFIDEIDSVISLDFSTDDFFALIRYFYNQRAENPEYYRLSFALFGVATPSDLIGDRTRTPFNIGKAIELQGFSLEEATPLTAGFQDEFANKRAILQEILNWTGGQPFLTQKLCQLAIEKFQKSGNSPLPGYEAEWIEDLVLSQIITSWESQDEPEHIRTIRDRILRDERKASRLLRLAEQIGRYGFIPADETSEQRYLLLSNLVIKKGGQLIHRNLIYQRIFNLDWIERQQNKLCPFQRELESWLVFQRQDTSRLLRGQTLQEALAWAEDRDLSQSEYQFITASQQQEQQEITRNLELKRLQEVEAKLTAQSQSARKQTLLNITLSFALGISFLLSWIAYQQYRRAVASELQSNINEIKARTSSANALFSSHQKLDALIAAIQAKQKLQTIEVQEASLTESVDNSLSKVIQGATEYNRLLSHQGEVWDVAIAPDGKRIVSASADSTLKLWKIEGEEIKTLSGHVGVVRTVAISRDGRYIVSGGDDGKIRLWSIAGKQLAVLSGHDATIQDLTFSPDSQTIASAGADGTLRLWNIQGKNIFTIYGNRVALRGVAFSPDGKTIAIAKEDNVVQLWDRRGNLVRTLKGHSAAVLTVDFSPDGKYILTGSDDRKIVLWSNSGEKILTLNKHTALVRKLIFSPDGKTFASASADNTIKIWTLEGREIKTLRGHTAKVYGLVFTPDGKSLISASSDLTLRLWHINGLDLTILNGHQSAIRQANFSSDGNLVATASYDDTVKLWNLDGEEIQTLIGHTAKVASVVFSPSKLSAKDKPYLATASFDNTVKLWSDRGEEIQTLIGHQAGVRNVAFHPHKPLIATASADDTVKLWNYQGQNLKTFTGDRAGGWDVEFSPDGRYLASASEDGTIKLWDFTTEKFRIITGHTAAVLDLKFSPDGKYIASGSRDNTVKIWQLDGKAIATLQGHQTLVRSVAFSPDGKYIASGSGDKTIKLWSLAGEEIITFRGHNAAVRSVAFSPDGKYIVSASEDNKAILWDIPRMLEIKPLEYACDWVKDYLETSIEFEDRQLCHTKRLM